MKTLSPHQTAFSWWVEVSIAVPQQTYRFGPFRSREEAKISRSAHVEALNHQEARDIVALVKQR